MRKRERERDKTHIFSSSSSSSLGIGGTIGALGGMGMALFTGYILDSTGSYEILFAICASAYLAALLVVLAVLASPPLRPRPHPENQRRPAARVAGTG